MILRQLVFGPLLRVQVMKQAVGRQIDPAPLLLPESCQPHRNGQGLLSCSSQPSGECTLCACNGIDPEGFTVVVDEKVLLYQLLQKLLPLPVHLNEAEDDFRIRNLGRKIPGTCLSQKGRHTTHTNI